MTETLDALRATFDAAFEPWGVSLPEVDAAHRKPGYLRQSNGSGSVRYVFGRDEGGEYLEYYSFHRIWGDTHGRIRASGEHEHLDTLQTMYMSDRDDPSVGERNQREMVERNRKLLEELEAAGLMSCGPVPMSFTINAHLVSSEQPEQGESDRA